MPEVDLPTIDRIRARGWQSDADWDHMARIMNAHMLALGVELFVTGDEIKGWLANAADIDRKRDYVLVDVADETIAYALSSTYEEHSGRRIYRHNCKVDPKWQGQGIGTALLEWQIVHHAERLADIGPGFLQTEVTNDDPALTHMLEDAGYKSVEHDAELVRPNLDGIPDRPLPAGVETRPVEPTHLRTIHEADVEAFKDHWGARPPSEGDWQAFLDFAHRDESLWKIAWDGDEVVGQVRGYINSEENEAFGRKRGWAEFISTAREWRGQGIASALICATLREFKARGLTEAALGVHVGNPTGAYSLYQSLGFAIVSTSVTYERPLDAG